jgi:hypothetical protein
VARRFSAVFLLPTGLWGIQKGKRDGIHGETRLRLVDPLYPAGLYRLAIQ